MHQIILMTALTATSGLFGGGRAPSCASGTCGMAYAAAPSYATAPTCAPGTACGGYVQAAPMPVPQQNYYYQAPSAQPQAVPATPQAPVAPPQVMAPQGYYYPTAAYYPASSCAGGTCYRR